MPRFILSILIVTLALNVPAFAQQTGRDRVLKIDAVVLIDSGKEIEGKVEHQHQHGRYTYLFSSADHLATFKASPAKYEIQQNGACGRMGPLSGEGSPKIFAVHDARLYIFASEQCRRTFVASPEKFIEADEAPPATDEESLRRGAMTIKMIAANAGLLRASDPPVTVRQSLTRSEESGGKSYTVTRTVTWLMPDGVHDRTCWNADCWTSAARGDVAWSVDSQGPDSYSPVQRVALLRDAGRHPWRVAALRDKPGFIAVNTGQRRTIEYRNEAPQECSVVTVYWDGVNTTLAMDGAGRCRAMSYRGRGLDATIGDIEHIYSAFHVPHRHELPGHVATTFNGKPVPEMSGDYSNQAVNDPADLRLFEAPADLHHQTKAHP